MQTPVKMKNKYEMQIFGAAEGRMGRHMMMSMSKFISQNCSIAINNSDFFLSCNRKNVECLIFDTAECYWQLDIKYHFDQF